MVKVNNKYIYLVLILVGMIATGVIASTFQEQETSLHLNSLHASINANETEYMIIGSSDVNATVYLSSNELNLNNVSVDVDSKGNFKYKLTIPQNITDVNIALNAIATGKLENHTTVHIERPTTSLSLNDVNFTEQDTYILVSGKTDPHAHVIISSSDLAIESISLVADSSGLFRYQVYVPQDKNDFKIKVESQILGKKVAANTLSIVRIVTPKIDPEPTIESSSSSPSSEDSSSSISSDSSSSASGQVIITRTGSKYHMYKHGNMKYISYMPLSQAKQSYDPCKICC